MSSLLVFVRPAKGAWRDAVHVQIEVNAERCFRTGRTVLIDGCEHDICESPDHGLFAALPQYVSTLAGLKG